MSGIASFWRVTSDTENITCRIRRERTPFLRNVMALRFNLRFGFILVSAPSVSNVDDKPMTALSDSPSLTLRETL